MSSRETASPQKSADDVTSITSDSSDFCLLSLASSSPIPKRRLGVDVDGDELRATYLHRLEFEVSEPDAAGLNYISGASSTWSRHRQPLFPRLSSSAPHLLSTSLDDRLMIPTSRHHTKSSGRNRHNRERHILLRRSEQYTVDLKFDKSYPTDIKVKTNESSSTSHKFELSSAWANFLSSSDCSVATAPSSSSDPLDGAYDLFSLPSDSSFNKPSSPDCTAELFESNVAIPSLLRRDSSRSRSELSSSSLTNLSHRPRRKVSFDSTVIATTIPSRLSYSDRVRSRLWSSTSDTYVNAVRNEHEFVYDGSNWRTAAEEVDFVPSESCSSSGLSSTQEQLVHPFHKSRISQSIPKKAYNDDRSNILEPETYASFYGEVTDEDDAFETGVFTME